MPPYSVSGASSYWDPTRGGTLDPWTDIQSQAPIQVQSSYQGMGPVGGDPFAYTNGSLLTPWTQQFQAPPGSGGGYSPPQMSPFTYGDLNFSYGGPGSIAGPTAYGNYTPAQLWQGTTTAPGEFSYGEGVPGAFSFSGQGTDPGNFTYDQLQMPGKFVAPNMIDDPGYKVRKQQMIDAAESSAAMRGTLRGGDFLQALNKDIGEQASQEYQAAWNRAYNTHQGDTANYLAAQNQKFGQGATAYGLNLNRGQQLWQQAAGAYDLNLARQNQGYQQAANTYNTNLARQQQLWGQEAETARMNEANRLNAYTANQATHQMNTAQTLDYYRANADASLGTGALQWQIASGMYDRNRANAADMWDRNYAMANAAAAAGASNSAQSYNRAMNEYQMAYDIFRTNQSDQFSRLYAMANLGMGANSQVGNFGANYAAGQTGNYMNAANAYGAGQMAGANAWSGALGAAGDAVGMGFLAGSPLWGGGGSNTTSPTRPPTTTTQAPSYWPGAWG